jgi:NAD(P)-dependent dehydrogenase (short-subunit alcohol dehydrogenase family)
MIKIDSENSPFNGKSVLITGCSSGIGCQTAIMLAQNGFLVFATVRKEADAEKLCSLGYQNLIPVCPLDLTNLDHIKDTASFVREELNRRKIEGLFALINNGGAGMPSPIELMDLAMFARELQARLLGSVAMVQSFLDMIRRGNGRIVWIMTPALIPTPYVASIHSCDFAVNCLARTLEIELQRWNIPNIMIKCGGIKTPAGMRTTSDVELVLKKAPPEKAKLYEIAFRKWSADMTDFDKKRTDPERVAEIVLKAVNARKPKHRYSIGYMSKAAALLEAMPQGMADWILKKRFK